jgi:hypothetical protein
MAAARTERQDLVEATAAIVLTQLATWGVYVVATYFLTYLLPGYPRTDWLCGGTCTVAAFKPVVMPFLFVAAGQLTLFLGLRTLLGRERAWSTLLLSLVAPGVIVPLISSDWAIAFLMTGVVVQVKSLERREFDVAAAAVCLAAPPAVAMGLMAVLAFWNPRGGGSALRSGAIIVAGLAIISVRAQLGAFHDAIPSPGPRELLGVERLGWLVVVPLVLGAAHSLLDERTRGLGLMVLTTVLVALLGSSAPALRSLGALPLAWVPFSTLPRQWHAALLGVMAMLQGVLLYHLAHQVPVL